MSEGPTTTGFGKPSRSSMRYTLERDMLKIAHYACVAYAKMVEQDVDAKNFNLFKDGAGK